jgi:hypothetical protein
VTAEIDAIDRRGVTVARTTSDDAGRYYVAVAPGVYTLHVNVKSQYPRCPDTQVTVRPGETATADISCDTGIR